jgi:hypothetical protein
MNQDRRHEKGCASPDPPNKRNRRIGAGLAEGMNRAEILVIIAIVITGSTVIGMWTLLLSL